MRAMPANWPDQADPVQEIPAVYLRLPGSAWPPASVAFDGEELPAGTARVGEWSIDCDLDAPLMPGQINTTPKFTIAEAKCTIPQPEGGLFAPWRTGGEAPPRTAQCELVASYDGHSGTTAFVLGRFILDPVKGALSDPFLSLTMVQDLVRLHRDHTIPTYGPGFGNWPNSQEIIKYAAVSAGYAFQALGSFVSGVNSVYFPRKTDQLAVMQETSAANLGAVYLSMDGTTVRSLGPDYLAGAGPTVETIDVGEVFEDLVWTQDPGAAADRVEVSFIPPIMDPGGEYPAPFDHAAVWTAPKNTGIPAGATYSFDFDPGTVIGPYAFSEFGNNPFAPGSFQIMANRSRSGAGDDVILNGWITQRSSGNWAVSIHNSTSYGQYLVLPWDPPVQVVDGEVMAPQDRGWGAAKGTPSFIPGSIDRSTDSSPTVIAWGVPAEEATNTLQFNLGKNVQIFNYAAEIFNRVVARVQTASYVVDDVNVVPNLGRELGDIDQLTYEPVGFDAKAMVTGIKTSGDATGIHQLLSFAVLT